MKILKHILFAVTLISIFAGCKKKPTACFTTDVKTTAVNYPIKCDASCSKNAEKYYWLGEGTRTPDSNDPAITNVSYPLPGTYTIKLEVTNGRNDYQQDIVSQTVKIY